MNQQDWQTAIDPKMMLEFLRTNSRTTDRKLRLFAVACGRESSHNTADEFFRRFVDVAERYPEGQAPIEELVAAAERAGEDPVDAYDAALDAWRNAHVEAVRAAESAYHDGPGLCPDDRRVAQAHILRDIFGPLPFRVVPLDPSLLTSSRGAVLSLARAAYEDRHLPEGTLDNSRLAVLADAVEEAGLTDQEVLGHLRSGGPHWRGCFALDLILQKE